MLASQAKEALDPVLGLSVVASPRDIPHQLPGGARALSRVDVIGLGLPESPD